jgi:hypothetical protein
VFFQAGMLSQLFLDQGSVIEGRQRTHHDAGYFLISSVNDRKGLQQLKQPLIATDSADTKHKHLILCNPPLRSYSFP